MNTKLLRSGLLVAAMLVAPLAANAADLRAPSYKAPAYVAPVQTWSGFYVGLNTGYAFGTADWVGTPDPKPTGFLVGATVGYNLQTGSWVWGVEGDLAWSNVKDTVGGLETEMAWFGTARGRIGYGGWGSFMPYITAGAAFGNIKNSVGGVSESDTKIGWTAGLGVEYMMWSSWSLKLEYLYADLGTINCTICGGDVDYTTHIVRAGLNYRF
jgi:outer membrane immunogenic protein